MKKPLLLIMIVLTTLAGGACQKQGTSAANSNAANSTGNVNQTSEQTSAAPKGLKPSEPCGWLKEALMTEIGEYKQRDDKPGKYDCYQLKPINNARTSSISYQAKGDAEIINEFSLSLRVPGESDAKEKEKLHTVLSMAATEIADRASGIKLNDAVLTAILSGDDKDFALEPSGDSTKPQLKTVSVQRIPSSLGKSYSMDVDFKF